MTKMKKTFLSILLALVGGTVLSGCIAIPPLINVQHKDADPQNQKKLDAIEKRLERLEEKLEKRQ